MEWEREKKGNGRATFLVVVQIGLTLGIKTILICLKHCAFDGRIDYDTLNLISKLIMFSIKYETAFLKYVLITY